MEPLKIHIVGCPGSGKSTLGRHLSDVFDLRRIELDGIAWKPGWNHMTKEEFQPAVIQAMSEAENGWVMDGNYFTKLDQLVTEPNTIVWLDLPKHVVMRRVTWRTISRAALREELWNGNREPLTNFYKWDPDENIIRWAWVYYDRYIERYEEKLQTDWSGKRVVRMSSPAHVRAFMKARNPLSLFNART